MLHPRSLASLPTSVDLSPYFPDPYDQGQEGSCSANMSAAMLQYDQKIQGQNLVMPSRQFDYYNSRLLEGTTSQDAGATIADALKAIAQYGWCPENLWPYKPETLTTKPTQACYTAAASNKISDYGRVQQTLQQLQGTLAAGHPIGFGFIVYPSFESDQVAQTGVMPLPTFADLSQGPVGGHAVVFVGYDNTKQAFLTRNSWGLNWGLKGHFWMPYTYATNRQLASDFWVLNSIPGTSLDFSIVGD
jgi:C1A family cysteine protease